ncbi:MAG: glycosyltransferase [Candidatus Levybacteria bacterium]|nr:glycosyltransferase [Candidatus Levybacteria bacterium]
MKKNNITVSIIIVNYRVEDKLRDCIKSIIKCTKSISYEIIVVDNDEEQRLSISFKNDFPFVKIINNINTGFGAGNNLGSKYAHGKYLFFLNPDTRFLSNAVKNLYDYLDKNEEVGLVAPQLFHPGNKIFKLQGMTVLTPLKAIFSLSFLYRLFPNNRIANNYFLSHWNKKKVKFVDVVPGTAFMIRKELFYRVGKFDETFFLYFEEFDLCKRLKELGYKACIIPQAKIIHYWGESTAHRKDISRIFSKSRFFYFKKHYGFLMALLVESFLRVNKASLVLLAALSISLLLMLYRIDSLMVFIGDQAWFYLSARDLLIQHTVPLVGIASSHPWLHQGAYWTYVLAFSFFVGGYDPLVGAYASMLFTLATGVLLYIVTKKMFYQRIALFTVVMYLFSPLILFYARMPYHTVPIPLFIVCMIYTVYQWVNNNSKKSFYASFLFLGVLYNFELVTVFLFGLLLLIFIFGLVAKKEFTTILSKKDFAIAFTFFIIPLIPIIIYDLTHGFKQTIIFGGWIVYHLGRSVFAIFSSSTSIDGYSEIIVFLASSIRRLIFLPNLLTSLIILLSSLLCIIKNIFAKRGNEYKNAEFVILGFFLLPLFIILFNKVPSDAYLPVVFPSVFIMVGYLLNTLFQYAQKPTIICFIAILSLNALTLVFTDYGVDLSYEEKKNTVQQMMKDAKSEQFSIKGVGQGSEFDSFIMPYEYILWYYGHSSVKNSHLVFEVQEFKNNVIIKKSYD